jgi:type II secretory pathway pseudopilin PulG
MSPRIPRRGITLMEVLIAIGILAVGLTSVVSLVPAGQSQAARAVILDRAAATVANGLQDAVTYGLTRPDSISIDPRDVFPLIPQVPGQPRVEGQVLVFDPVLQRAGVAANAVFPNAAGAFLKTAGIYAQASTPAGTPSWQVLQLLGQGRDDLLVSPGAGPDDPPVNRYDANDIRLFNGRMSCLFSVARADNVLTTSPAAGDVAKLTVVAFHNRNLVEPAASWLPVLFDGVRLTISLADIPSGRTLKEIIRPGAVIYDPNKIDRTNQYLRWSQVLMASIDDTALQPTVYVTFASPPPIINDIDRDGVVDGTLLPLRILLDSVGMAEQMVVLEGSGAYSK